MSRWSLRARVLLVVSAASLLPVALLALSHWVEDAGEERLDVELTAAVDELAAAMDADAAAAIAERHAVHVRVVDLERALVVIDVDRERGSRVPDPPLGWLYPSDVPTLADMERSAPPLIERARAAPGDRTELGCRSDPRGALLVCHAARRVDGRAIYVQRGFVRGAVRAVIERKRELYKLVLVLLPIALALGAWLSWRLVRPLEALRDEALERARAADPGAPLTVRQADEIGDVARALNTLLAALSAERRASETFVTDLAHEVKNPVASIRACADALAGGEADAERRARLAKNLRASSDRLDHLVSELLELARVEARAGDEPKEAVDLAALARGIAENATAGDVRLTVETEGDSIVSGVEAQLETALRNLIDNATSFARREVRVELACEGGRVRVRVSDDGPGIAPEALPRVFDRFFTTRGARRGTGLGLAMVRAIAEAHGGTVRAEAPAGGGATFEISLPRV